MANSLRMLKSLPPLETMVCFEAVARCGSFTSAARELFITQSAVSKQIKSLEDALGCALFVRHARGIRLSTAGTDFQKDMEPLLHGIVRAVTKIKYKQHEQAVSIACTDGVAHYWLYPRLVRFSLKHPQIMVNVLSSNRINALDCAESDLGILYGAGDWPMLEGVALFPEVIYPACSPQLQIEVPHQIRDLCKLPLIQLDSNQWDCTDWQDWFAHFGVEYQIPQNAITFNQLTLTLNAALDGLGVSLVWDSMARPALETGRLRRVGDFQYETGHADYLVHTKQRPLSDQAAVLYDWLISAD